ncbi:site-specific DNA-methyltransferase [Magnetospirillum aberrantis]|uniref:site-specific DNA-methyltransferase n=1 Tax=Magnetospirillum aberrantis TaxID=1105283 RepID=UPI00197B22B5|nr:site-specific DNA-methyltransferase [Magnetospirillum aberrantis]
MEALKALLPEFEGRIDCIYIDPPYNTGNENWVYNDAVNDPRILRWLNKVVGKEGEDFSRHDKWLCMMYPRLKLLHRLLADEGSVFVSIDDSEAHHLRLLLDEIFGAKNFIATVVWQRRTSPDARVNLGAAHDYILAYAKDINRCRLNRLDTSSINAEAFKNPDNDPRGPWVSTDFTAQGYRPNQMYTIVTPGGASYEPPPKRCWGRVEPEYQRLLSEGRMWFGNDGNARPRIKTYLSETEGKRAWTWWANDEVGHNQESKKEIFAILGEERHFDTPKPERLIRRIVQIAAPRNGLVLDSYAGSGTTAHAVLEANRLDNGNRRFILVEMMDYAESITAERVRRVMDGYGEGDKRVPGLGGGFAFYAVGQHALFDDDGHLNPAVDMDTMRRYLAYTEGLPAEAMVGCDNSINAAYVGSHDGRALLFHYQPHAGTTLDYDFLAGLNFDAATRPERLVVYADYCTLGEDFLARARIVFKKIPRDLTRL